MENIFKSLSKKLFSLLNKKEILTVSCSFNCGLMAMQSKINNLKL